MKTLKDILKNIDFKLINGNLNSAVTGITLDSRKVEKGNLFIAINGNLRDGHKFIGNAIEKGATHIVCEDEILITNKEINIIRVKESLASIGLIAGNFYDHPSQKLNLVGITGTNGKTTIATLLYYVFKDLGFKSGLISTIKIIIDDEISPTLNTTPDAITLNYYLSKMVNNGCVYCFMEVSSHAIVQERIKGLNFRGGVFTNITRDHLDYHKTFKNYLEAKKAFFDQLNSTAFALINLDDKHAQYLVQNTKASIKSYSLKNSSDYKGKILESDMAGLTILIDDKEFHTNKVGTFNAYNLLAVYATATLLNIPQENLLKSLSNPIPIDGRFEIIRGKNNITGIVDYAHTPDALENVLRTIKKVNRKKGNIIIVFGCGGNRDKGKRPMMGKIASVLSDKVIITSDNPRNEFAEDIINDIKEGIPAELQNKNLIIQDRKMAIKTACLLAQPNDIILVAGKGHEKYQEINDIKYEFDDKIVLSEYIKQ